MDGTRKKKNILSEINQTQIYKHGMTHSYVDIICKAKDNKPIVHDLRESNITREKFTGCSWKAETEKTS